MHNEVKYKLAVGDDTSEDSSNLLSKRVRKNRDQIKALQIAFERSGGNWTKNE